MDRNPNKSSLSNTVWRTGLQTAFHLLYNQLAWTYDAVSGVVSAGKWREWQRSALPFVLGPRVLELGHGPGHTLLELQQEGHEVVGLDLSPAMGRMARRRGQTQGETVQVVRGRAQSLPFADTGFNTVLSLFPTPYIVDPVTLGEVHRVLTPGGRLIILPEARLAPTNAPNRILEQLYRLTGQRPTAGNEPGQTGDEATRAREAFWTEALQTSAYWTPDQITVVNLRVDDSHVLLIIAER